MLCQSKLDIEMVWYYGWDYIHSLVFVHMPESLAPSVHAMFWIMNGRDRNIILDWLKKSLFLYGNFVFVLVQLHNVDQMSTNVFITESLVFVVNHVMWIMWIIIADYYLILPASSDHLTLRASIILWLKCPLLAAVVFHFALHSTSLLCKKPYYLQIVKSSILHFLQLSLNLHTEESADMNHLDLSSEKFSPCL